MIEQNKGKKGEDFVNSLAEKTYLNHWCFFNPLDINGNNKEICDLLILFDDICIIAEIKNYEFKGNYDRYNKKTIEKALNQIQGAERKLFSSKRNVVVRNNSLGHFNIYQEKYKRVHRLIINLGQGLMYQFLGKQIKDSNKIVHILTGDVFNCIVDELRTIDDLSDYLLFRHNLLENCDVLVSGDEKDLIAYYIALGNERFDFITKNKGQNLVLNIEGQHDKYKEFLNSIEDFDITFILENFLKDLTNKPQLNDNKIRIAFEKLYSLKSDERTHLGFLFLDFIKKHCSGKQINRRNLFIGKNAIVLMYYPKDYHYKMEHMMYVAIEGFAKYIKYEALNYFTFGISDEKPIEIMYIEKELIIDNNEEELEFILSELGWFDEDNLTRFKIEHNFKIKKHPINDKCVLEFEKFAVWYRYFVYLSQCSMVKPFL